MKSSFNRGVLAVAGILAGYSMVSKPLGGVAAQPDSGQAWPAITRDCRPHAYWWWMGSAADTTNITRELERYQAAGMGGVHIIPIYGAKGWEKHYVKYLSPAWMNLLRHSVAEGARLGLDIDMTTGTGWCFGGPSVPAGEASGVVVSRVVEVPSGGRLKERFATNALLMAYGPGGQALEITSRMDQRGTIDWAAPEGAWRVYAITMKPTSRVKRAAPGGEGYMLNLFYRPAMVNYLSVFEQAFKRYEGPRPRAMYHDSYEYSCNWSPDLFARFQERRGYSLKERLPAVFAEKSTEDSDARVRCDLRETLSDLMIEETLPMWVGWSRHNGMLTRNQAHGSPGNLLDLYGMVDIPETEMFDRDRSKLVSKFASSAGHVMGRKLVASETGTWLREHFRETLGDMKGLLDDLFLSGVNHVFYHGTCYSPDEAGWPGWVFYASYEMNPRNSVWRDVPALNAYVSRCQSVLQAGRPDNDILVYWPIHEFWRTPGAIEQKLTVHHRGWLEEQPIGATASNLWERGYAFDYISDRQLALAKAEAGGVAVPGGHYQIVLVPPARFMPVETMERLLDLARDGATVVFQDRVPEDVPGFGKLEANRARMEKLVSDAKLKGPADPHPREVALAKGKVVIGSLDEALATLPIKPEKLVAAAKLSCIRRADGADFYYFVVNETEKTFQGWVPLARPASSVVIMDPLSGASGRGPIRKSAQGEVEIYLELGPRESTILRTLATGNSMRQFWPWRKAGASHVLTGSWSVSFIQGGPVLPEPFTQQELGSWTEVGGAEAQRFAGTASYKLTFDAPPGKGWFLDLGRVCQSARVRVNGENLGTLFMAPFRVYVPSLKPKGNILEVEVTNVSANRIRDLDRRKVPWRTFNDINFVNIRYQPFDASEWPLYDSGLLGPVTLIEATAAEIR